MERRHDNEALERKIEFRKAMEKIVLTQFQMCVVSSKPDNKSRFICQVEEESVCVTERKTDREWSMYG